MPCEEWYRLLCRYQRAVKNYHEAVGDLDGQNFDAAWPNAQTALKNSNAARAILFHHEYDHGCTAKDWDAEELVLGDQHQSGG